MKSPEANEGCEESVQAPPWSKVSIRLVSRPDQKVLREYDITLPEELVAALTITRAALAR
jgi:hypothetical protein